MSTVGITSRWSSWAPQLQALLRMVAGFLFMWPGSTILFGYPMSMPDGTKLVLLSQIGIGGVLEFFGGILIVLGLFTRPVAFILAGEMAVAYWQFHAPKGPWPILNGGTDAAIFCFVFLFLSSAGAGAWSLDSWRAKRGS